MVGLRHSSGGQAVPAGPQAGSIAERDGGKGAPITTFPSPHFSQRRSVSSSMLNEEPAAPGTWAGQRLALPGFPAWAGATLNPLLLILKR
jgi:hypothetical protein